MRIASKTMQALWGAMRVLTDENGNSGQYLRECSRTTGTPYRLDGITQDLDGNISEEDFVEKYYICFLVPPGTLEASKANARECYRGYRLKKTRETQARKTIEDYDAAFLRIEIEGHL